MNSPLSSLAVLLGSLWFSSMTFAADKVEFARDIRPILARHCQSCHGPDEAAREAGLRLDLRDQAVAKKAIVPGDPKASKLIARIHSPKADAVMPPPESKKPLTEQQKQLLQDWIAQGADYAPHWAFRPPQRPAIPAVSDAAWVRNPIDAFTFQRMAKDGLRPSPEADKATLLRRVTLDLTGLPPTPEAVAAFVADNSPNAYEKVVDRLLQSPAYGEKMAMGWLDAARFADTNGFNNDEDRTQWPWRDWVIEAFQKNMPFDQFLTEQIAGDLLPNPTTSQLVATAFLRNQTHNTEGGIIQEEYRVEYVADRVHTTATVFFGLSLGCARCHDHKFDPISQKEYYRFFAFFNSVPEKQASYSNFAAAEPYIKAPTREQQAQLDSLDKERLKLESQLAERESAALKEWTDSKILPHELAQLVTGSVRSPLANAVGTLARTKAVSLRKASLGLADEPYRLLQVSLKDLTKKKAEVEKVTPPVMVMKDMPTPRDTFILKRGAYDQHGEKVTIGVPAAVADMPKDAPANRLGLARWMTDPKHPLTARVAVNRWWQSYFGTGLVKTVEDFGLTGELPSHPELLDYLATELIATKWDVRAMQKLFVMSATYRQSSKMTRATAERDPENRLLARGPRFRMSAEMIRDNALAVSGLLKEHIGGPSVKPYQPGGLWEDVSVSRRAVYVADKGDGLYRRTMYTFWKRTCPPPTLQSFDAPNREVCVARRAVTNTPLQALILLNDPTYVEAGRKLAEQMMKGGKSPDERLEAGYKLAVARSPDDAERKILMSMQSDALAKFSKNATAAKNLLAVGASPKDATLNEAELAAWTVVAGAILNLDETISKR
ncbi:PSD1 and planctomycete cytochrome C domain-containing protein [Zavarzinella formosa]|uniref:PSD1 and planctomycete cytochrome C domain-containing protein n=1 Tax=Zavarzinella formosa TaxID=360055 RepID=UPI0002E3A2A6|nr:PSD1 and planctomycete cytochrome C domain-containing protein [Zavarzinella formosa]